MRYPIRVELQDLKALFRLSLRSYLPMLRCLFVWLLVITAVKDVNLYWSLVSTNPLVHRVMFCLQWLAMIYLLCCMVRVAHFQLLGESSGRVSSVLRHSIGASFKVFLFLLLLCVILFFLFYMGSLVQRFIFQVQSTLTHQIKGGGFIVYIMFLSFLFSYALVRFIFVLPLWSIYKVSFLDAIVRSNELSGRYWLRLIIYYAFVLLFILFCSQSTSLAYWALKYHLNFVIDLALLSILIPVASSLLLLLQDDLTERVDIAESV